MRKFKRGRADVENREMENVDEKVLLKELKITSRMISHFIV